MVPPQNVIIAAQPLYGSISPQAHGEWCTFQGVNIARGLIHGYLARCGAYIDDARNTLVGNCLDGYPQATHIFFADQDMFFTHETIKMLLDDDVDVVSGIYFGKDKDFTIVGWESLNPPTRMQDFDPDSVQEVAGMGMGCALIRTSVFRKMELKYRNREWYRSERSGEDFHFCRRCHEMDIPVWLDGRVRAGHLVDGMVGYDNWKLNKLQNEEAERAKKDPPNFGQGAKLTSYDKPSKTPRRTENCAHKS